MEEISVNVEVKPQKYSIFIGHKILKDIALFIKKEKYAHRYAIITDSNVKPLYALSFFKYLQDLGLDTLLLNFPAGEKYKTRETKTFLDDALLNNHFGRDGAIVALGGGVVGDVAGFVAATYMRGIPYIQIPTTVISQADSSIGGKTAVDYPQGKNLIGSFHHPKSVFIDTNTLLTLDNRNYRSGLIEIIKHGLIRDSKLFEFFTQNKDYILNTNYKEYPEIITKLMRMNCAIKNDIVSKDTRERNLRKILNYGHTVGHAIEHLSGYSLLHGEAVSIGIAVEAYFSYKLGFCSKEDYLKQIDLIKQIKLPSCIPDGIEPGDIIEKMFIDKKARGGKPEFVIIEKIGKTKLFKGENTTEAIDIEKIKSMLSYLIRNKDTQAK